MRKNGREQGTPNSRTIMTDQSGAIAHELIKLELPSNVDLGGKLYALFSLRNGS